MVPKVKPPSVRQVLGPTVPRNATTPLPVVATTSATSCPWSRAARHTCPSLRAVVMVPGMTAGLTRDTGRAWSIAAMSLPLATDSARTTPSARRSSSTCSATKTSPNSFAITMGGVRHLRHRAAGGVGVDDDVARHGRRVEGHGGVGASQLAANGAVEGPPQVLLEAAVGQQDGLLPQPRQPFAPPRWRPACTACTAAHPPVLRRAAPARTPCPGLAPRRSAPGLPPAPHHRPSLGLQRRARCPPAPAGSACALRSESAGGERVSRGHRPPLPTNSFWRGGKHGSRGSLRGCLHAAAQRRA
eukprot:scaffold140_cov565-Prasinococcus_capsulatus_cf.AAC.26